LRESEIEARACKLAVGRLDGRLSSLLCLFVLIQLLNGEGVCGNEPTRARQLRVAERETRTRFGQAALGLDHSILIGAWIYDEQQLPLLYPGAVFKCDAIDEAAHTWAHLDALTRLETSSKDVSTGDFALDRPTYRNLGYRRDWVGLRLARGQASE
jgi:hypothetical protein